ncbi:MAG TPA: LLM class flavin-dependent oxidoreductase [Actinomycetota bacterium]|jgi:phthiodiolone/phenolphthiodiolone dimycocerosates ketoreductase|nr:LLM class flavin-dependent oxidoreductase [Actinomycetota bacterium]
MPISVGVPGSLQPPVEALTYTAKRNEERGFDVIWWPDHLMGWHPQTVWTPDILSLATVLPNPHMYFDPIAAITAAATATDRIQLGTSVTEPFRNHPAQLARAWLTLDHLTAGRAILGIGAGEGENITPYGMSFDRPATTLQDALRVIRLLWENDEPVDYAGPVYTLEGAVNGMGPHTPGRFPPIWVAAHGPRMCRITGELADGWLPTFIDLEDYASRWQMIRDSAITHGRDPDGIVAGLWRYTLVAEDHELSHRYLDHPMVKALLLALPASYFEERGFRHPLGDDFYGLLEYVPARLGREEAMNAIEAIPFELAHDALFHGTPDDLAKTVGAYAAAGLRHIAFWNVTFFNDVSLVGPSYKLLTEAKDEIKKIPV